MSTVIKYHMSDEFGVNLCSADERECPVKNLDGSPAEHYEDFDKAWEDFEKVSNKAHNPLGGISKTSETEDSGDKSEWRETKINGVTVATSRHIDTSAPRDEKIVARAKDLHERARQIDIEMGGLELVFEEEEAKSNALAEAYVSGVLEDKSGNAFADVVFSRREKFEKEMQALEDELNAIEDELSTIED